MTSSRPSRVRLESVDLLRGVIMIIMALDHVRDFLAPGANPVDLSTTTPALFFTRWITHFCAPVFFLLTGTGARLSLGRKTRAGLSRFLLTRGLWLLFLELVVVRCLGLQFNFDYHVTIINVLWALGWAMISLSALIWLPTAAIATIALVMIGGHNLLDGVQPSALGALAPLWVILHVPGMLINAPGHVVFDAYPIIPWIGVTAAGFAFGTIYGWDAPRRRTFLVRSGIACSVGFVVLRAINGYGDPSRWSTQHSGVFTLLSFLNTTKYPPSLLFLLMTLGPAQLFLAAVDGRTPALLQPAVTIGKVPMFYYLLHLPLIHLVAVGICAVRYGSIHWMFESPSLDKFPITPPPGWDVSLSMTWLVWVCVVVALYPACRWWAGVKRTNDAWWVSYL